MIRIVKLAVNFGKRFIFRGFEAQWPSHGLFGVIGPSGSGKTTLFKVFLGQQPYQGLVHVHGMNLAKLSKIKLRAFQRNMFGWIDQDFSLFLTMTVEENLLIVARIKGFELDHDRRLHVHAALQALDIKMFRHHILGHLSGGERQRIALAAALIGAPPILIGDEPFSHMDQVQETVALSWLKKLSAKHFILISSHHTSMLKVYCDQTWFITPDARFHVNVDTYSFSRTIHRGNSALPFRAVWKLIQSMRLGQSISKLLEFLFVSIVLILVTLVMILRLVTAQIQQEIMTRLGDGLTMIKRLEPEMAIEPISMDSFEELAIRHTSPRQRWGVMGSMDIDLLEHHQLYLQMGHRQWGIPDFDLHAFFNHLFTFEHDDVAQTEMELFEISLGLNTSQWRWAEYVFQTTDLKSYLTTHTPRLLLKVAQPSWAYEDVVGFDWVDVTETATPTILHSNPMFISSLFHDHMQLPLKNPDHPSPLQLSLNPFVWLPKDEDKIRLEELLVPQHIMLDRITYGQHLVCRLETPCLLNRYGLYRQPYSLPDLFRSNAALFLPLSQAGLVRIEEAFIYGFQKRMYMSLSRSLLEQVQDLTYRQSEERSFSLMEAPGLFSSYAYAPSSTAVIWKPMTLQGGVILSSRWKMNQEGIDHLYFLYEFHRELIPDGYVQTTYRLASLPILDWIHDDQMFIGVHPTTFEYLLEDLLQQSSRALYPNGFVTDSPMHQVSWPAPWSLSMILSNQQQQTEQWISTLSFSSFVLGGLTALPLITLLLMLYDIKAEPLKQQGRILMHHGLEPFTLVDVFTLEVVIMIGRWWFPIMLGIGLISMATQYLLGSMFLSTINDIPWKEALGVTLGLGFLALVLRARFQRQMHHHS